MLNDYDAAPQITSLCGNMASIPLTSCHSRGIHRLPMDGPVMRSWMFSLLLTWIKSKDVKWRPLTTVKQRERSHNSVMLNFGVWRQYAVKARRYVFPFLMNIYVPLGCKLYSSLQTKYMKVWYKPEYSVFSRWDYEHLSVESMIMMTPSNGKIFRVTGHLCGEFTGLRWIPTQRPVTRSFDYFFDLRLNKRLSKQS